MTTRPTDQPTQCQSSFGRRYWPLTIALAVFVLGAFSGWASWRTPYLGVVRSLGDVVSRVEPGGPGTQAKFQVGDRLTHVDGVPIGRVRSFFGSKRAGDTLSLSLIRDGTSQTITVRLATPPPRIRLRRLSYLIIAFTFWLVGTFALVSKPALSSTRLFFALCQAGAAAPVGISLIQSGMVWPNRLISVCILLSSALLIHFHTVFPRLNPEWNEEVVEGRVPVRRLLLGIAYGTGIGLSLLHAIVGNYQLSRYEWFSLLRGFGRLYFVAAVLSSLAMLFHSYRATDYGPVRRRVRLVLFGTAVALLPLALLNFVPEVVRGSPLISDEVALLSLAAIPLAYGYGIVRHNLMGIDLVINRTLVYFTLTTLLILGYMAIVTGASLVTGGVEAGGRLIGAAASVVVAAGILPLRTRVQSSVDQLFDRAAYDYRAVVGDVSERLSRTLHEDRLEDLLVEQLSQAMGLKGVALMLPGETCHFGPKPGRGHNRPAQVCTDRLNGIEHGRSDSPEPDRRSSDLVVRHARGFSDSVRKARVMSGGWLAQYLVQVGRPVEADQLRRQARVIGDGEESPLLGDTDIRLWVPLVLGEELEGVLLLGAKHTDEYFSREDHQILATLAHQAALAAKNQQLVEELRERMAEIAADKEMLRQMHRQVVGSREEERKRLSWELHDQTVQSLLGLKMQVEGCVGRIEDGKVKGQLTKVVKQAQEIVDEMRRICADLRPPLLDEKGLAAAVRSYIKNTVAGQSGLSVRTAFPPDEQIPELPEEMGICLYRVVQEALQNVQRHAQAREAWVEMIIEDAGERAQAGPRPFAPLHRSRMRSVRLAVGRSPPRRLELLIVDDGQGFAVPEHLRGLTEQHHFGLVSMRERVEAIGGQLTIHSQPGQGTTVRVTVPLSSA